MSRFFKRLALITCCVAGAIAGYHEVNASTQPSFMPNEQGISQVATQDLGMARAINQARATAPQFIAVLQAPQANQTDFALKIPVETEGATEHIWLNSLRFENDQFIGRVANQTANPSDTKLGDEVTFPTQKISDWMYVEDGLLVGGSTLRYLRSQLTDAERQDYDSYFHFRFE